MVKFVDITFQSVIYFWLWVQNYVKLTKILQTFDIETNIDYILSI